MLAQNLNFYWLSKFSLNLYLKFKFFSGSENKILKQYNRVRKMLIFYENQFALNLLYLKKPE